MIKTLRYAFVAALMMVAGAVNAQTTKAATTEKITIEFYDYYKDFEKQGEKKGSSVKCIDRKKIFIL